MALDKWIAAVFLLVSIIYGYAAFTYHLLPFERNMAFLPNTLPMVLSVFGGFFSLIILLTPSPKPDESGDALGSINKNKWREYKVGQALGLLVALSLVLPSPAAADSGDDELNKYVRILHQGTAR